MWKAPRDRDNFFTRLFPNSEASLFCRLGHPYSYCFIIARPSQLRASRVIRRREREGARYN